MVRSTKRPFPRKKTLVPISRDGMDAQGLLALDGIYRRQYRCHPFRKHAFTGSGRSNHEHAQPACRRHGDRPFSDLLSNDIGIVKSRLDHAFRYGRYGIGLASPIDAHAKRSYAIQI